MPTAGASTTAAGRTGSQDESDVGAVDPEDMDTLKRKRVAGAGYHPHSDDGRGRMHAGHHSGGGILPVFGDAASKGARVHVSLRVTCTPLRLQLACLAVLLAVPAYILVALALVAADSRVHMMRRMTSISILPSTGEGGQEPEDPLEIAIITLGDCRKNWGRNFQGINEATIDNKATYAARHGYRLIDASKLISKKRPTSWSKVIAVRRALKDFDWVMWMDADAIFTNPTVRIEDILPPRPEDVDLVITKDWNGYNAGVWLMRNSTWGAEFLDRWWAWGDTITIPVSGTRSGDNDCLKALLKEPGVEGNVWLAEQSSFNSYYLNHNLFLKLMLRPWQIMHMMRALWVPGDFIIHLAGINNKMKHVVKIIERVQREYPLPKA
mmetsp:Transcript_26268/g.83967  ORF Transcript_26268/g.83967 Transcript_26268/m.83967 type:complete len:381 (-) Transcript_26268:265-1407(-)